VITPFNQPLDEPALTAQAPFQASHPAIIVLVIIAKKVQQAMKGQHLQLDWQGVPGLLGLTGCNPRCDHDIAEISGFLSRERQHIGCRVFAAVLAVQRTHACVRNHRHGHLAAGPVGCD